MDVLLDEGGGCAQEVLDALRGLNLNAMSPMEAMMKLYELQNQLKGD